MRFCRSILPTSEMLEYLPGQEDLYVGREQQLRRFIFTGIDYTEFENRKLTEFRQLLDDENVSALPDHELLRGLISFKFDFNKTVERIKSSLEWKNGNFSNGYRSLYGSVRDLLDSGSIYIHGRDRKFRPVLVLNLEKFNLDEIGSEKYI